MKKILMAAGIAAVALCMTSCDKGSNAGSAEGNDSLSILLGDVQGSNYNGQWKNYSEQVPDSVKATLDKKAFLNGMRSVILKDPSKDNSYIMGVSTALQIYGQLANMKMSGVDLDFKEFMSHFEKAFLADSVDQQKLMIDQTQLQVMMNAANDLMMKKQQEEQARIRQEMEAKAAENVKAGKAYVEKVKKEDPKIKTLESGVSYKVIKEGTGSKPGKSDVVKVNYVGKHIDGSEFDSSNGEPRQFNVSGVVPGFSEILQMMAPGAKYVAYLPSDQAYGDQGAGNIKPGETLIFEIEMVEVVPTTNTASVKR